MIFRFVLDSEQAGSFILPRDPKGWDETEISIRRGLEYHGFFYDRNFPLEFQCGSGKEYIDNAYETYGVDVIIRITISISCSARTGNVDAPDYSIDYSDDYGSLVAGGAGGFESVFEGILDMKSYTRTQEKTSVGLINSDFFTKVRNRLDTQVELTKNESLDGVVLDQMSNFPQTQTLHSKEIVRTGELFGVDVSEAYIEPVIQPTHLVLPGTVISDEVNSMIEPEAPYLGTSAAQQQPVFRNDSGQSVSITIEYSVDINITTTTTAGGESFDYDLRYEVGTSLDNTGVVFLKVVPVVTTAGDPLTTEFSDSGIVTSVVIPSGEKLFLQFVVNRVGGGSNTATIELNSFAGNVKISYNSETDPSQGLTFPIHEIGAAITQRITGEDDAFRSNLLGRTNSAPNSYDNNGCLAFMVMTNGKLMRGFSVADAPFFMSMNQFFKTVNAIGNVGLGVEKEGSDLVLRIDSKEYFYDSTVLFQFNFVPDIRTTLAKEYYTSDLFIGYEKWETENINGIDEPNTKRQYNTGIKTIENRVDLLAPAIASMYAIELTRRQGDSSTDWKYDNDLFIICTRRTLDGAGNPSELRICEKDEHFDDVDNLLSPETAYNLRISPARNVLRHMNVISGSLIKYPDRALVFTYGEGNFKMTSDMASTETCVGNYNNEEFSESQDILWTSPNVDATPIWIPEYLEFEYPLTLTQYRAIYDNPKKCIEVSDSDTDHIKGYIIEMRYKPVGGKASFKLLRAYQ